MTTLSSPTVFGNAISRDRVKPSFNWRFLLCMLFCTAFYASVGYVICWAVTG